MLFWSLLLLFCTKLTITWVFFLLLPNSIYLPGLLFLFCFKNVLFCLKMDSERGDKVSQTTLFYRYSLDIASDSNCEYGSQQKWNELPYLYRLHCLPTQGDLSSCWQPSAVQMSHLQFHTSAFSQPSPVRTPSERAKF